MTAGCIHKVLVRSSWWTNTFGRDTKSYILATTENDVLAAMMITGHERFKSWQGDFFFRTRATLEGESIKLLADKFFIRLPGTHSAHITTRYQNRPFWFWSFSHKREGGHWTKSLLFCQLCMVIFQPQHLQFCMIKENYQTIRKHFAWWLTRSKIPWSALLFQ